MIHQITHYLGIKAFSVNPPLDLRKIAASGEDYAVVKSINEIGHFLGKKTIGEYVADEHILRCISEIGVDFAQGYGIAPPMLLDDLLADAELT